MNEQLGRLLLAGSLVAVFAIATACTGGSSDSPETPVSVATRGTTLASPTGSGSVATPTAGAAPPSVASPSATVAASETTAAPTTVPQTGGASTSVPQPTTAPKASAVSLTFRAANLAFDKTEVHVPAGATITATLQNDDVGQEHNLTFGLPGLPHGDSCKGPCTATQVFKVETSGTYSFLCTIHDMFGTFIVDP